mmetsp:Transcript_12959/g.29378  ORF Transcript_12959/g.29378 Transcript_12959/m.29378 type:complete len:230 (-) Transcript_12959:853-1542(-)
MDSLLSHLQLRFQLLSLLHKAPDLFLLLSNMSLQLITHLLRCLQLALQLVNLLAEVARQGAICIYDCLKLYTYRADLVRPAIYGRHGRRLAATTPKALAKVIPASRPKSGVTRISLGSLEVEVLLETGVLFLLLVFLFLWRVHLPANILQRSCLVRQCSKASFKAITESTHFSKVLGRRMCWTRGRTAAPASRPRDLMRVFVFERLARTLQFYGQAVVQLRHRSALLHA